MLTRTVCRGAYFYFTFTLAYAVDSYTANTSEMLIAMCVGKQMVCTDHKPSC